MILYHGSFLDIVQPDLIHSRPNVDFGRGFYATSYIIKMQREVKIYDSKSNFASEKILSCY